jgi:uncharacterized protein (TIGR00251 family)
VGQFNNDTGSHPAHAARKRRGSKSRRGSKRRKSARAARAARAMHPKRMVHAAMAAQAPKQVEVSEDLNPDVVSSIKVRVSPKAAQGSIVGWMDDGYLKVRILAAPEGGRANIELLRLLGHELRIPISNLSIVRGSSSTDKILKVVGLDEKEVRRRLTK